MDDKYFKDKISGYFDGDLKPDEMEMMREWLENSEEGQKALAELGRLDEFVEKHSQLSGGEDFWEAQAQKIEARLGFESAQPANVTTIAKPKSSGMTWKLLAAAASIVLLAYIGINEFEVFGPEDIIPTAAPELKVDQPIPVGEAEVTEEAPPPVTRDNQSGYIDQSLRSADTPQPSAAKPEVQSQEPPAETESFTEEAAPTRQVEPTRQAGPAATQAEPTDDEARKLVGDTREALPPSAGEAVTGQEATTSAKPKTARRAEPTSLDRDRLKPDQAPSYEAIEREEDIASDSVLSLWRRTYAETDSALQSMASAKDKKLTGELPEGVSGFTKPSGRSSLQASLDDRSATEKRLLEACYQVARLSPDSTEQQSMRARLESYAGDLESPHRALARSYLDRLKAEK